jgi:hypothetical protein
MAPEVSTPGKPAGTTQIVNPTQDEIAKVAYQLWLDSGCLTGLDQEHWFRAEAILRNELVVASSASQRHTRNEIEIVAEFTSGQWDGHWEVWEREWNCAHWVWDVCGSGVRASNSADRTAPSAAGAGGR